MTGADAVTVARIAKNRKEADWHMHVELGVASTLNRYTDQ